MGRTQLSEEVWSIVRYKVKDGFEEEFIKALKGFAPVQTKFRQIIRTDQNRIADLRKYASLDDLLEMQMEGLDWLDEVEHLLELYGDSRTEAFTGFVV